MHLVAISTVEIHAADSRSMALQARLSALVETLQALSGCTSYTLTRCSSRQNVWIMTGYWSAQATMQAHFSLPCLTDLFALTLERFANALKFGTFQLNAPAPEGNDANPCRHAVAETRERPVFVD
ncbi:putative quinol monooxygenase [Pseudomonas sp. MWU13-2105]|uniref:putative quinol monooxygenase n=1 Tax=Pseudomonas sp. MWU13-2105 TaxID=2935074 RepID=UPI00201069CA|nr:antibiotic biosynthesis monooxygenase [Pseudomonas sp. MWU13-2105]